ncbi:enoyl-CoA hydratase/isomerase family protein [Aeromicrobium sp.]|uniref:enoyl-CoA hydratase/isomerase family protein n=1 Tax=Aeromicrobium sp. TaxID=1871063 RepID=UPI0025C1D337|nr:enoyl-CoA hydratase/isomerase family protein [Aeromicrobium sp.]MCK5890334.1 enoyl-CoA hydratase/isomerase family protein [Aeromicrobium sp.]
MPEIARAASDEELVITADDDHGIVTMRLNRPQRLNALSESLVGALEEALAGAVAERRRAVILTGTGRAFSAGFDLREERDDDGVRQIDAQQRLGETLATMPVPVIAAVNGLAIGGGCEIALACDVVLSASDAVFGLPEVRVGTAMGGGTSFLLARAVGRLRASYFVLLGEPIGAVEAHSFGMVSEVVDGAELPSAAFSLATKFASRPPYAIAAVKAAMRRGLDQPFAEALRAEREEIHATQFHPESAALIDRFRADSTYD